MNLLTKGRKAMRSNLILLGLFFLFASFLFLDHVKPPVIYTTSTTTSTKLSIHTTCFHKILQLKQHVKGKLGLLTEGYQRWMRLFWS